MEPVSIAKSAYGQQSGEMAEEEREQLILEHLPQVRLIARRIHERLPESVTLDDLISTGIVGLIKAIDRFDPTQNVKLKTYAEYKIRGAILDSLRSLDWALPPTPQTRQTDRGGDFESGATPAPLAYRRRDRDGTGPDHRRISRMAGGYTWLEPGQLGERVARRRRPRSPELHLR